MRINKTADICVFLLILLFLIVSIITLAPHSYPETFQSRASALTKKTTKNGNMERTDYLDGNGRITIASKLGYATMIVTIGDSYRYEHFYDDQGEPVQRYPGYYALLKEYDEKGNNYHISYLDLNDLPVVTKEGYSDKYLTFYDTGKIKTEKYYDTSGNPVNTFAHGYGFLDEYSDKGRKYKTTYLGKDNDPIMVGLGYAIVVRQYYETNGPEKGKVESEFYFDENEKPVALSLGQYGVHKQYDEEGRETILTYLDADGKPIITNKGYTTIVRTFHADNSVATELYYDKDGNSFALADGQYGIKKENDQLIYLNQDGEEIFNLKRLLYNRSWVIIPATIIMVIISGVLNRKWNIALLLIYIPVILYLTLMFRDSVEVKEIELLRSYRKILTNSEARIEIIRNMWLFIPLGSVLFRIYPKWIILLIPIGLSVFIEIVQFYTMSGYCELDDVISNELGGFIGFCLGNLIKRLNRDGKCRGYRLCLVHHPDRGHSG